MLYSKKIYKDILSRIIWIFSILILVFSVLYLVLYNYVDVNRNRENLRNVFDEFVKIDKAFDDFIADNYIRFNSDLANDKMSTEIKKKYYELSSKLDINFQLNYFPQSGKVQNFSKYYKNYLLGAYQRIINDNTENISKTSIQSGKNISYVITKKYPNGYVSIYVPTEEIKAKINTNYRNFYITDKYNRVIVNDSYLVSNNLDKINKIDESVIDNGEYIHSKLKYEDFTVHSVMNRSMTKEYYFQVISLIILSGLFFFLILLKILKKTIKESTKSVDLLINQINLVSEGDLEYIKVESDDEIEKIAKYTNKLIESRKLLIDRNLRLKYKNKYNEFKMLESQFNPHFLYNTLELISITMYIDPKLTEKIIQNLNEILRYSINELSFIRLDEDISYIYKFLDIQKIKDEDNLDYRINIDEYSKSVLVPKLFLQPLVENSLKYVKSFTNNISIIINITTKDKHMKCEIIDNGKPLDVEKIDELNKYIEVESKKDYLSMQHHGLANTYNRLRMLYKEDVKMYFDEYDSGVKLVIQIKL